MDWCEFLQGLAIIFAQELAKVMIQQAIAKRPTKKRSKKNRKKRK